MSKIGKIDGSYYAGDSDATHVRFVGETRSVVFAMKVGCRIESCCKKLDSNLLFSSSVKEKITDKIDVKRIGSLKVKGKTEKLVVFTVG